MIGGDEVAEFAKITLVDTILKRISEEKNDICMENILNDTLLQIESNYIETTRPVFKLGFGQVANVGSCAVVAVVSNSDTLYVANCGDCRAVVGSSSKSATQDLYYATQITRDHNARVPLEKLLLKLYHPQESDVYRCKNSHACYVKGRLQLTHALGDLYLKHSDFNPHPNMPRTRYNRQVIYHDIY